MEWRPIESAPRDGTPVYVWFNFCDGSAPFAHAVKYVLDHRGFFWKSLNDTGEAFHDRGARQWFPLPPPPTGEVG